MFQMKPAFVVIPLVIVLSLVSAGCGDTPQIDGRWEGASRGISLSLTLQEQNGTVSGGGNITIVDESFALEANGAYTLPSLSLTLSNNTKEDVNLRGMVLADEMAISGVLNGSGFENFEITLFGLAGAFEQKVTVSRWIVR